MRAHRRVRLIFCLIMIIRLTYSSIDDAARAYAFVHVVSDGELMGDERTFGVDLSDTSTNKISFLCITPSAASSPRYIHYTLLESHDIGVSDPWSETSISLGYSGVGYSLTFPYFEVIGFDFDSVNTLISTNVMFYRLQYTCSSLDYYTESEILSHCTNNLGLPASLFE